MGEQKGCAQAWVKRMPDFANALSVGVEAGRPSIYTLEADIRKMATPALIVCGDEDDPCVEPSLFLKKHAPASGLVIFPKTGHALNTEEPALFNEALERFIGMVEAGRWPVRDPRSLVSA